MTSPRVLADLRPRRPLPLSPDQFADGGGSGLHRRVGTAVLATYLVLATIDGFRKMTGSSASVLVIAYLAVAGCYLAILTRSRALNVRGPRTLPVWLTMITVWCLASVVVQRIPVEIAAIGIASYVYFVPLVYAGILLTEDERELFRVLRFMTTAGAVIGIGAMLGALFRASTPFLLQPIVPTVGIHTYSNGNIYLAPSIFATAEEASEYMLVAFFAWLGLGFMSLRKMKRSVYVVSGIVISAGLVASERRAELYLAAAGLMVMLVTARWRSGDRNGKNADGARGRGTLGFALSLVMIGAVVALLNAGTVTSFLFAVSPVQRTALMLSVDPAFTFAGQGAGTSTQGVNLIGSAPIASVNGGQYGEYAFRGRTYVTVEGGFSKVWLELGLPGMILYTAIFASVLGAPLRKFRSLGRHERAMLVAAIALGVVFLKGHQSLDNPLVQPLFWVCAGIAWKGAVLARKQDALPRHERSLPQ